MPDAVAPATPEAAPVAPAAEPLAGAPEPPRKDRSAALIEKAVKQQKRLDAERAAKELGEEPAEGGAPQRDPETGKFLPAGAKPKPKEKTTRADAGPGGPHKPAEPGATPGPATKTPTEEPEKPGPSADSKARRLVKEGKLAEAMQTIGLDPSKLESPKWAAWRKQNEQVASRVAEARQQVEAEKGEVQQLARSLVRDFEPFIKAKAAFDKGDYEEAFQHAFGLDLNSFQRRALQSMTQPGVAKDPVIAELRKEIQALKQEREQERHQMTEQQQQAELNHRRQQAWNANCEALAESGDPRMAELSKNPKFMRIVWAKQAQNYDAATDSTLPPLEAAEEALEELEAEHSEWAKVFGGASAPSAVNATLARQIQATPGPSGTSARRTAKAVTTLNPAEAAEAAPTTKLKGKELIEYHTRKARAQMLREELNGS